MKRLGLLLTTLLLIIVCAFSANAEASGNYIKQNNVSTGKTGASATVTFQVVTDDTWDSSFDYYMELDCTQAYADTETEETPVAFPFEYDYENSSENYVKHIGTIAKKTTKSVSFTMKVRRDAPEGYYKLNVKVYGNKDGASHLIEIGYTPVRIYVKKSTGTPENDDAQPNRISWEIGEGQPTPVGKYPAIMNFSINLRNSGTVSANDVKAAIVCESNSETFPFDINEANYDRHFEYISANETVPLNYSFAIRSAAYTGYYPIKLIITYREGTDGPLQKEEKNFFVHVFNKDKENEHGEFNPNDRTKARIIVDSFRTVPEQIYAGDEFDLFVTFKNASTSIDASNLLLSFDSEKVSESPIFLTSNGSNSVVVNALKAQETTEIQMHFSAAAGIDQRIYSISISQKYDSPEFKNAEEKVSVSIPVHQIAKFNMGTVEIMPDSLNVGDECNVMFPINNTGKVILYNTMVRFEADTIETTEVYVGNIKPGETGNVDVMLRAMAPSTDTGKINVIISYEDEYGKITENNKEILVYVNENYEMDFGDFEFDEVVEEQPKPFYQQIWFYIVAGAVVAAAAVVLIIRYRKKKEKEELANS